MWRTVFLERSRMDCLVYMICSTSSREKPRAELTYAGRIFFHTLMMQRVKLIGNQIRNTVDLSLKRLKSSRLRTNTLDLRRSAFSLSFFYSSVIEAVSSFKSSSNTQSIQVFLPTVTYFLCSVSVYSDSFVSTFPVLVLSSLTTTLVGTILYTRSLMAISITSTMRSTCDQPIQLVTNLSTRYCLWSKNRL